MLAVIVGQVVASGYRAAATARAAFHLPKPAVTAPPIPAGASFDIAGLSPIVTPNADFYRIDTALQIPGIDPANWRLKITGMVEKEIELTFAELLKLPLEESTTTLACVSNEVGGNLISNATWLGYPIRHLLARAKPTAGADMVLSKSQDGWTAGTPLEALTDERNAILAVGMNGQPLPLEHGYPVRMVVPGLYGYVSATKWVVELDVTRFDKATSYWVDRGWSERGPVKLESRIDVPSSGSQVAAGTVAVAGSRLVAARRRQCRARADRRRPLAAGRPRRRDLDRHLAAVEVRVAGHEGLAHASAFAPPTRRDSCRPRRRRTSSPTAPPACTRSASPSRSR